MPPALSLSLALLLLPLLPTLALSLSTISISRLSNATVICAFIPSPSNPNYTLTCIDLPSHSNRAYATSHSSYAAVVAGNGFLCALGPALTDSSNVSTMRWWEFSKLKKNSSTITSKRIYRGSPIRALSAGDSYVCGLVSETSRNDSGNLVCWRWPELNYPQGINFADVAVGGDFVCGLVAGSGVIRCFGGTTSGVTGNEPKGNFNKLAAGTRHACAVSKAGQLICWGTGYPKVEQENDLAVETLALGEDRTCILTGNGTVVCLGNNSAVPANLVGIQFVALQARGDTVCGVLMANYSLVCWGNKTAFGSGSSVVFDRVLSGPCAPNSSCRCGVWAGSANVCAAGGGSGVICHPCTIELHENITSNSPTHNGRSRRVLYIILSSVGAGIVAAILLFLLFFFRPCKDGCAKRQDSGRIHAEPTLLQTRRGGDRYLQAPVPVIGRRLSALISKGPNSTVEQFPLSVLLAATDGFSESHKIGSGSFGLVYRARLPDGRAVAIKRATEPPSASARSSVAMARRRQDRESAFLSELALLSRVNHKNLVRLYGFCIDDTELVLVYEYMENGTLYDHLHKKPSPLSPPLDTWNSRLRLALDAARGIEYLHTYAVPPIIHRDIKSANILLDASWTAKVSDFGLSLLRSKDDEHTDDTDETSPRTAGTVGYMDPEYYRLQHLTDKSDVYSFGVVLLELLSGSKAIQMYEECGTPSNVVEFAVPQIAADDIHCVLDKRLPPPTPTEIEAVAYVGYLAADCVAPVGRTRPTMAQVVCRLERAIASCVEPVLSRSCTDRSE